MSNLRRTAAVAVLATVALSGCGKATVEQTTSSTSTLTSSVVPTTAGATPVDAPSTVEETTAVATPAAPVATSAPTSVRTGGVAPSTSASSDRTATTNRAEALPTDPGEYADAAIAAAMKGDRTAAARYVAPSALAGLSAADLPKGELLRTACDGDMCSYSSEDGKRVTVTFDMDKVAVGAKGAITRVKVA